MKRKIFILAAIVTLTAVCAVILAGCADVKGVEEFSLTPASEQTRESVLSSDVAYEYLEWMGGEEMISRYGSVDSGEINVNYGIGRAAMALAAEMDEMGYLPQEDIAVYVGENGAVTSLSANSQKVTGIMRVNTSIQGQESLNVVYVKPAKTEEGQSSAGQVVITAHFDNLFDMPSADGQVITAEGAYENGAAVAAMLYVAQLLQDTDLPFDVVFAFLGSSVISANNSIYYCWNGASALKDFLPTMFGKEYNLLLNITLWRLGGGEKLYMYSSDRDTSYNNYFYAAAAADGLDFAKVPEYKHAFTETFASQILATSPSGVFHPGLLNDSIYFVNDGVPTLTYMSLDWEGGKENSGGKNCAFTGNDTLSNMLLARGGGEEGKKAVKAQLNGVALNIVTALTGENAQQFLSVISTAREELADNGSALYGLSVATMVLTWALVIGFLVAAIVLRGKNVTKMAMRRPPVDPTRPPQDPCTEFNKGQGSPFEEFDEDKNKGRGGNSGSGNAGGGSGGDDIFEGF